MFGMIKGNPENLRGTAILYVTNIDEDPKYPALMTSDDITKILILNGIDQEDATQIRATVESLEESLRDSQEEPGFRVYAHPTTLTSPEEIMSKSDIADIIHVGYVESSDHISCVLLPASSIYIHGYRAQLKRKLSKSESTVIPVTLDKTYKDYDKDGLQSQLQYYCGQLCDALNREENKRVDYLAREITQFMKEYQPISDVMNLIGVLRTGNLELATLYMRKIVAICSEEYETAMTITRDIQELNGNH